MRKEHMRDKGEILIKQNKIFAYLAFATCLLLSIPLLLGWSWGSEDFIVAGALLFGAGSLFILIARVIPRRYRALIGVGIAMLVLWLWAELAVGLFTNWGS